MSKEEEIKEFIGEKVIYSKEAGLLFGVDKFQAIRLIGEVRGWGAIQNLFKDEGWTRDFDKAQKFQDQLGEFLAEAITEKLTKSSFKSRKIAELEEENPNDKYLTNEYENGWDAAMQRAIEILKQP